MFCDQQVALTRLYATSNRLFSRRQHDLSDRQRRPVSETNQVESQIHRSRGLTVARHAGWLRVIPVH